MPLLPIFLKLSGRRCLVVGAGTIASDKIASLLHAQAELTVVAPDALDAVREHARATRLQWKQRTFAPQDLDGILLVITATSSPDVNRHVYRLATDRGILCNSVDDPPNCDFYFSSVVERGGLQIAISTAGESPALAQRLRREIDAQLAPDLSTWLQNLGELRRDVLQTHAPGEQRKMLLHELVCRSLCELPDCPSRQLARAIASDPTAESRHPAGTMNNPVSPGSSS